MEVVWKTRKQIKTGLSSHKGTIVHNTIKYIYGEWQR